MSGVALNQSTFDERVHNLAESIAKAGFSPDMSQAMGAWGQEIMKNPGGLQIPGGMAGPARTTPTIRVPFVDAAGANAGASFVASYANAEMARGDNFLYPVAQLWSHGVSDLFQLEVQRGRGANIDPEWRDSMLKSPTKNFWLVFSTLVWDNGMGILGVGNGLYNVTSTLIKLQNFDSAHRFHKFQRIALADPAQTVVRGQLVTPRALAALQDFPQIVGISRERGELTVNINVDTAIPTAVNTDWIVPATFFSTTVDGNPELAYNEPTKGFGTIVPWTDGEVAEPVFGVDQTEDEEARAGVRVVIDAGASVEDAISLLAEKLTLLPADAMNEVQGTLYFPARTAAKVMDALHRSSFTVREIKQRVDDRSLFMLGMAKVAATFPTGHTLGLVADKMLCDPFVTRDADNTYAVVLNDAWSVLTTQSGFGFKSDGASAGGGGILRQVVGNQQGVAASFGAWHIMAPTGGPGKSLLMTPVKENTTRFTF